MRGLKRFWWLLLAIPVVIGLVRLKLDVDVLNLLPTNQAGVRGIRLYQDHFSNARELILTVRFPDGDSGDRLAAELGATLRAETNLLSTASWQPPWMEQPALAAEIIAFLWFNQPPAVFGSLTNRLSPQNLAATLGESKQALATSLSPMDIARRAFDPFNLLDLPSLSDLGGISPEQGQQMFASSDGTFRLIFLEANRDLPAYRDCVQWLGEVRKVVEAFRTGKQEWKDVQIRYTGRPAFVAEIATSMQRDLSGSILGTAGIIALLFYLTHRRWLPMLWLLALLALILIATMGIGSLLLGPINVVSLGFAAVLLGLAVDYAVVHYQEALSHPELAIPEIRRAIAPSILWAAITTITAFLVLNFGALPGLAQLGSLVAIGVAVSALIMVAVFLPPLFPDRRKPVFPGPQHAWWTYLFPPISKSPPAMLPTPRPGAGIPIWLTGGLIILTLILLTLRFPGIDRTGNALRFAQTEAEQALNEIQSSMGIPQDSLWLIAQGKTELEVSQRLSRAEALLGAARSNGWVQGYIIPTALWPRTDHQAANRDTTRWVSRQGERLREAALREGFQTNALFLTEELLKTWDGFASTPGTVWPTNRMSQWLLKRFVAHSTNEWLSMGIVHPPTNQAATEAMASLSETFAQEGLSLSGWSLLGTSTLKRVRERLWWMILPMGMLVLLSLWLAFRTLPEVLLGLGVLLLSGLCLLATMGLAGWTWNLLNLMAVPLILGTGVDYGIFIQLGLRRHQGDTTLVRRSIGRALLLCGGTAIAGFGSLAWSGSSGMASLGKVCATGIAANMLISIFLLPSWWLAIASRKSPIDKVSSPENGPSSLYSASLWRMSLVITRLLPYPVLRCISLIAAELYRLTNSRRREIVIANLLPALAGDRPAAEQAARRLYRQFTLKLLDLWRYEVGIQQKVDVQDENPLDALGEARKQGRGILIVTPHLGNWEIGGPLLKSRGITVLAITQPEPGSGLTELRTASRARWGIETLVVGRDAFAFVEIIRRLQEGAVITLLMDRPVSASAVEVELFGRPFLASSAAADLARASGCALFAVTVTRQADRYTARMFPEITYDRTTLNTRELRQQLTQRIMRIFEPEIQRDLDQWFHFVPIWPEPPHSTTPKTQ
jgi:predicted exporter/lauroyl/myristoyl acyltransferase